MGFFNQPKRVKYFLFVMVFKMASNREKLPNLKICLDNTEDDNDIEEELSIDDNVSDEDDIVVQPEIVADDDEAENVEFNVKLTGVQSENVKEKPKFKPEVGFTEIYVEYTIYVFLTFLSL